MMPDCGGVRENDEETTVYHFAVLDPRNIPAAQQANQEIINAADGGVYGVEVTVPEIAARCDLGNLDPQHTQGLNIATCVAALTCQLPPNGATLVTVRPDADSVLAMAILTMRLLCQGDDIRTDRVQLIGSADSAPSGPWVRDYSPPAEFAQVNAVAMDHRTPIALRVSQLCDWLDGFDGLPIVTDSADHSAIDVQLSACGRYAIARADGPARRGACGAGYRNAPIVIAVNEAFKMRDEAPHRKYTIARWNATHVPMDWDGLLADLNSMEPGWVGAGRSICGSPQGIGSTLTLKQVIAVVERHLV